MRKSLSACWFFLVLTIFSLLVATSVADTPVPSPKSKALTANVGSLKGEFQVTPSGQAHYSIPIEVSPGTAGMSPALAITYDSSSSNTRNGLLGMGFSLDGLTAITRCPSNKTQNGVIHGVDFTDKDRFCFNGEQLIVIKGEYGADGTEYRTYVDSKAKIISYGKQGNGPASFKVWTKGGQVAEYAATQDSQIKAEGKDSVAVWGLNKIQDTAGNYLEVHYFKDEAKGIFYPTEINYTGNEREPKVAPYNLVKFIYEARPDTSVTYQAGSKNTLDKRLKTMQTWQGPSLVYEYRLTYEIGKNTARSRIVSIEKCSGNGVCLPATKFGWQTNEEGWIEATDFISPTMFVDAGLNGVDRGIRLLDLNGDGLTDIMQSGFDGGRGDHNWGIHKAWINTGIGWVENSKFTPPTVISDAGHYVADRGVVLIDLNGDGLVDVIQGGWDGNSGHCWRIQNAWLNRAQKLPDYLISITDGLGSKISIDYEPLSGTKVKVYTKEHDAKYPNFDWQGSMYVVYQTSSNTDINDQGIINKLVAGGITGYLEHVTTYHYTGAKFNHLGLGFLGFHKVTTTDNSTSLSTTTTYSQGFDERNQNINTHNRGLPIASETRLADGTLVSSAADVWELKTFGDGSVNTTYYFPYVKTNIKKTFDLKGKLLSTTTIKNTYDDYGNPTKIDSTIYEHKTNRFYTTITENTYRNNPDRWFIGELIEATVTKQAPKNIDQTRTSSFSYDPATSLLVESVAEPHNPKLTLATKYARDRFGNIIITTVSGKGIEDRVTKVKYDDYGQFVTQTTNSLGQSTSQVVDPRFGVVAEATDLNGLKVFHQYDGFGREILQVAPDSTKTEITYSWLDVGSLPAGEISQALKHVSYIVTTHTDGGATNKEYYDTLNRKIAITTQNMDGKTIWQLLYYDELGRVSQKTLPFFAGEPIYYTKIQYDVLGRITHSILPDNNTTQTIYDGFTTTIINQAEQKRIKEVNAVGNLVKTTDNLGSVTTYDYDPYSNMSAIMDSAGNNSIITYDDIGRKVAINDPDKGAWRYDYDVLGNLISQTDAKGQTTTFAYDKLNRMISRTDHAGTSTWEYDTALNGIGKLARINSVNVTDKAILKKLVASTEALHDGLETYTKSYNYDNFGRLSNVKTIIKNKNQADVVSASSYSYDQYGRLDLETYPNGLKVKNNYNELGYLVKLSDADTSKVYWTLNARDAAGRVISEGRSNGLITNYTYDQKTGFLKEIATVLDTKLTVQKELFPTETAKTIPEIRECVGGADECKLAVVGGPGKNNQVIQKEIYRYDDTLGNIAIHQDQVNNVIEKFRYDGLNRLVSIESSETGVQTLRYDPLGNISYKSDVGTYKYGENGAGPHAVTSIRGKKAGTFTYDANGDQVGGTLNGVERKITYTSYSKPLNIITPKTTVSFHYNADREKIARVDSTLDKTVTTYYLGNYESVLIKNKDGTEVTQQKAYIGGNTGYVKTVNNNDTTKNRTEIYEMLHNNLGSVTDITDENGNVTQHFSYTPFGEQKQTKGAVPSNPITNRGFTGHEGINMDDINLIHMDGRIYDPVIGRFLSADPYVQDPANSQCLNRYSYCINNPLAFVDPSGFGFFSWAGRVCRSIGKAVKSVFSNPVVRIVTGVVGGILLGPAGLGVFSTALGAAAAGAVITVGIGVATGTNFKQVLFEGAMTFGLTLGINHKIQELGYKFGAGAAGGTLGGLGSDAINSSSGKNSEKPKNPAEDFADPSSSKSIQDVTPNNFTNIDSLTISKSNRNNDATVGGTAAAKFGGVHHNGAKSDAYKNMFSSKDTMTGKETFKSFRVGALQIDAYISSTIQKGSSNIEYVYDVTSSKPLSAVNKEGFVNVATGMDGSITYGWTYLSAGRTADGRHVRDVSIPTGSDSSAGVTIYYDYDHTNLGRFIGDTIYTLKHFQSPKFVPLPAPIPIFL